MWLPGKPEDEEAVEASPTGQQRAGRRREEMGVEGKGTCPHTPSRRTEICLILTFV